MAMIPLSTHAACSEAYIVMCNNATLPHFVGSFTLLRQDLPPQRPSHQTALLVFNASTSRLHGVFRAVATSKSRVAFACTEPDVAPMSEREFSPFLPLARLPLFLMGPKATGLLRAFEARARAPFVLFACASCGKHRADYVFLPCAHRGPCLACGEAGAPSACGDAGCPMTRSMMRIYY